MNTAELKKFAQTARRELREQVAARLEQVLRTDSAALREKSAAVRELQEQIACTSKKAVIDRVAYTWFNRFCALRFMDVNHYTRMGVVSPTEGFTQPEILQEAKQGYIAEELQRLVDTQAVLELLNGQRPSADPQGEAYRLLLVGMCNFYNTAMPFLFEKIADYTELLMPQDLLSDHSILHDLREALTPDACQDVEVIGWLYQFYISERKDEVFEALKANQKIEPEDIPAATQLFTPHWIVRYLVENSLGRLWMLNHPTSRLVEQMDYYIKPEEPETDFLRVASPEEIKVCDPACGSGHMLTYAFDLLYAIYEEAGYPASDIPRLILERNLYGIEIDERAGALAAFALTMKTRGKDRRFFSRGVQPQICVLENISFTEQELKEYVTTVGRDLFTDPLLVSLRQFEHAKNFGALIQPVLTDVKFVTKELELKGIGGNLLLYGVHERVLQVLKQTEFLNSNYQIVVANPPYMGDKGMNDELRDFAKDYFPIGKSDLFAMFIERIMSLVKGGGFAGFMSPFTWMFLTTYEEFRSFILDKQTLTSLVRPEYHSFFESAYVPICAFTLQKRVDPNFRGGYIDLTKFYGADLQPIKMLEAIQNPNCGWFYRASSTDLKKIPGFPIAYWVSDTVRSIFQTNKSLSDIAKPRQGIKTGDNDLFLRFWFEVPHKSIALNGDKNFLKWVPCNKGGSFRKWYGNLDYVLNWQNNGYEIKNFYDGNGRLRSRPQNIDWFFKEGITWTSVSVGTFGMRYSSKIMAFESSGSCCFPSPKYLYQLLGIGNSKIGNYFLAFLSPTLSYSEGGISKIPLVEDKVLLGLNTKPIIDAISISKKDWDAYETSWDFSRLDLLNQRKDHDKLSETYLSLRECWKQLTNTLLHEEEENNEAFIQAYRLSNELTKEVPLEQITLTCNPYYRYGSKRTDDELEALLLADTIREFISYAVGCMFGRYSLDKPGLILANQGETLADYLRQVPDPTFLPDEDNVIPVLEGEWFSDDITERFKKFLRVTFGAEHYEENLAFIEQAIGRDIRSYFLKEFYAQHVRMYQKRPIYWMFSSPKGSFNVLIYMHRYKPDTISVILNKYLREFRGKLEARKAYLEGISISASAPAREKTAALKELEKLNKIMAELLDYERETLYPLAIQKIAIDLDDGVKANYPKFGSALAKIIGL